MSSIRVLLVEDFIPFRQFVRLMLENRPDLYIIGEVCDGLEAVHKTEEARPDLILLDIGLPSLDGIEAARRIRRSAPRSRILFVSQERDPDIVRKAFQLGASGYVLKQYAGVELLNAVETALQGRRFLGSGLSDHDVIDVQTSSTND